MWPCGVFFDAKSICDTHHNLVENCKRTVEISLLGIQILLHSLAQQYQYLMLHWYPSNLHCSESLHQTCLEYLIDPEKPKNSFPLFLFQTNLGSYETNRFSLEKGCFSRMIT